MARGEVSKIKKAAIGINVTAACLIVLAIFLMLNYLSYRHYKRFDWTEDKYYSLSDKTIKVVKGLDLPIKVYVFYQPMNRIYPDIKELLNRYQDLNKNIEVEYVDPEKDPARVRFLLKKFKISSPAGANLVVFEQKDRNKYVYDKDIVELDYSGMRFRQPLRIKAFKGEQVFTSAILNLTQGKQPIVYLVGGHGEKNIEGTGQEGLQVASTLLDRENLKVEKLVLYEKKEVPKDCDLLMIIGPKEPYMDEEKKSVGEYLENGGHLFVALDPRTNSGLETFLKGWDVDIGNNIVVDPASAQRLLFFSALNLFVNNYLPHEITSEMKRTATLFAEVRSVMPGSDNQDLSASSLVQTSPHGWGEITMDEETFRFDEGDLKGPVSIGVAVEANPGKTAGKPIENVRIVVIGDSDFIANGQIGNLGNASFFLNIVNWLTNREKLIAIGPKIPEQTRVRLNAEQMNHILWFSLLGLPACSVLLGLGVWWRRRK
jgi:ABC-type uncharacterized transport system involved in gliding motility auxiliary subunit